MHVVCNPTLRDLYGLKAQFLFFIVLAWLTQLFLVLNPSASRNLRNFMSSGLANSLMRFALVSLVAKASWRDSSNPAVRILQSQLSILKRFAQTRNRFCDKILGLVDVLVFT